MNNKNNSGWILCPSKRFPGKFYYYNVRNGESAWSFNESEKGSLRIDDETHVSQKCHRYPEPPSPPYKSPNSFIKSHLQLAQPFGHAIFPTYISPCALKWTPTPNQNTEPVRTIKPSIKLGNIDTHTYLPERDIVDSSKEPLSQRFLIYQHSENKNRNESWTNVNLSTKKDTTDNTEFSFPITKPTSNAVKKSEVLSNKRKYIEDSYLCNDAKIANETDMMKTDTARELNLAKNDLRYILQSKKTRTAKEKSDDLPPKITKKKVTFNIQNSKQEDVSSDDFDKEKKKIIITRTAILHDKENNNDEIDYGNHKKYDDLKKIKLVVKNETHKNLFLQSTEEFEPFFFSNKEHNVSMTNLKYTSNNIISTDSISKKEQYFKFRNNIDQIFSDEEDIISDVIRNITEKLHIKNPREIVSLGNPWMQTVKSRKQENPFRIQKSKINYRCVPNKKKSGLVISVLNSYTSNQSSKAIFAFKHHQLIENRKISSGSDFSCFSVKNRNQSNFASTQDSIPNVIRNSNIRSEIKKEFMNYHEIDKIETIESLVNDKLRKFYIRNKVIEERVILRMDELICCYTQIMEDFIYNNIMETSSCPPPYSLYDVLLRVQRNYSHRTAVFQVVDKITELNIFCPKTGYIQNNIEPIKLIKAIGCGLIFIEEFKDAMDVDIKNAENVLSQLLQDIEEPKYVALPEPAISAFKGDTDPEYRLNFTKRRTDIVVYLQKHFPEWKCYNPVIEEQDHVTDKIIHNNVLRIKGEDLHLLKINSQNRLYKEKAEKKEMDEQEYDEHANTKIIRNFETIAKFEHRVNESNLEENSIIYDISDESKEVYDLQNSNDEDKSKNNTDVFNTNVNTSKDFDEPIQNNQEPNRELYDLCDDDARYLKNIAVNNSQIHIKEDKNNELHKSKDSKYLDDISNNNSKIDGEKDKTEDLNEIQNNDSRRLNNFKENSYYSKLNNNDSNSLSNDGVIDISTPNPNQYYLLVKSFLMGLSSTLQLIYDFLEENLHRFRNGDVPESDKKVLYEETNNTYVYLKDIIEKLKSIIKRETRDDNALRTLLAGADGASDDKRITRYRQVVAKCLEQARIMENSLKILLHMTNDNCTLSVSSDMCDITYINIFE